MKTDKILKINGTVLDKEQLKKYLEKIASSHNIVKKSEKSTYPIPHLKESYNVIKEVYNLLNEHLKLKINIHPAGEWLLDNFYIIEQTVKQIEKELPLKKYKNLIGIANGGYKGFSRIYVLASEIVAYTDNKIEKEELEEYLKSYQEKKTLNMEEIWNIGIFLQIALIENIREISEKIYISQMQKYRAENIVERLVENKNKQEQNFKENNIKKIRKENLQDMKYPFIEYMSYILKRYGKKGYGYLKGLEEVVELTGTTVSEIIKNLSEKRLNDYKKFFSSSNKTSIAKEIAQQIINNDSFRTQYGVSCFSIYYDSEIMWGHYADSAKGFCLAYDSAALKNMASATSKATFDTAKMINPFNIDYSDIEDDNLKTDLTMITRQNEILNPSIQSLIQLIHQKGENICISHNL